MNKASWTRRLGVLEKLISENLALVGTVSGWFEMGSRLAAALLLIPVLIRFLGEDTAGVWFTYQSTVAMLSCVEFGLRRTFTRETSAALSGSRQHQDADFLETMGGQQGVMQVYAAARQFFSVVSLAGIIMSLGTFHLILVRSKLAGALTPAISGAWVLLTVELAVILLALPDTALLDGIAKVHVTRMMSGSYALLRGAAMALGAISTGSLMGVSACALAVSLCHLVAMRFATRRERRRPDTDSLHRLCPAEFIKLLKLSLPMGVFATGHYMMVSIQPVLIGLLLEPAKVTSFYIPFRLISLLNTGAFQVVIPKLAPFTMAVCDGRKRDADAIFTKTMRILALLLLASAVLFILAAPPLMNMIGVARVPMVVLILLLLDAGILYLCGPCADFVIASGRCPFLWSTLIWVTAGVALGIPLTIHYGTGGAVMATIIAGLASRNAHAVIEAFRMRRALATD